MSTPSPILSAAGRVYGVVNREVEAAAARPEERDPETGRVVRPALPARDGYPVTDVTILTEEGGFCTVSLLPAALEALGGQIPSAGEEVSYAVRPYVRWERSGGRPFPRVGYSVAGDVQAKRNAGGRRLAAAASS